MKYLVRVEFVVRQTQFLEVEVEAGGEAHAIYRATNKYRNRDCQEVLPDCYDGEVIDAKLADASFDFQVGEIE
jgi:hypothetical protein